MAQNQVKFIDCLADIQIYVPMDWINTKVVHPKSFGNMWCATNVPISLLNQEWYPLTKNVVWIHYVIKLERLTLLHKLSTSICLSIFYNTKIATSGLYSYKNLLILTSRFMFQTTWFLPLDYHILIIFSQFVKSWNHFSYWFFDNKSTQISFIEEICTSFVV